MNDSLVQDTNRKTVNYSIREGVKKIALVSILWAVLILVPMWLPWVGGYTALGTRVLIYALAAMSLNLLLGFTGGLSFGHAAFFGLGAYGTGLALKFLTTSTPLALLIGVGVGGLAAVLAGLVCTRRRGIYFAMITIAIGQLFYFIAVRWNSVTGGEDGLTGFARTPLQSPWGAVKLDEVHYYYFVLVLFSIGVAILGIILRSPLGRTFVGIRDNEKRLRFLGVSITRYVWISFTISGLLVALAGSLNALLNNFTSPLDLHWVLSGDMVIMVVLGGMRRFWGPFVGALIFVIVQDYVSSVTNNWMTYIGLMFVLIVLIFPSGVLGYLMSWKKHLRF